MKNFTNTPKNNVPELLGGDVVERYERSKYRPKTKEEEQEEDRKRAIKEHVKKQEEEQAKFNRRADILFPSMNSVKQKNNGKGNITGAAADMKNNDNSTSRQVIDSVKSFKKNYHDVKEANTIGGDKYFHAKANCEAAQQGSAGVRTSQALSYLREISDFPINKIIKGYSNKETIEDYLEDQAANRYGRKQGAKNPGKSCKVLVNKYRPNGLDDKY